jgi:ABC-2 type transport system ATP-binding protein
MSASLWMRPAAWAALTTLAVVVAPSIAPLDPTLGGTADAIAVGCLAGAGAFALLARRRFPTPAVGALPRRRLAARSVVLTAKSTQEEALWRALFLGLLAVPLGPLVALLVSTLVFTASHVGRQGKAAGAHLLTGTTFGAVYIATGRLIGSIAAHATYNVLVGAASMTQEHMSLSDTGFARETPIASRLAVRRDPPMLETETITPHAVACLEGVEKSFGDLRALNGVDLELRDGEILALVGPNGAGKSTAVAIMLGLRRADAGRASLFGGDPRTPRTRRHVGAVLQDISFPPGLRVRDAAELVRAHFPGAVSVDETLARLGLESQRERDAGGLSGGQRRRLAVALALAGRPRALFLDEPTAGMDASARRDLLRDITAIGADGGAVLLTTQQLLEVEEVATRIVLLVDGRVLLDGTVAEMRARGGLTRVTLRAPSLPVREGIVTSESQGERHVVFVDDADAFVARLVRSGVPFRDLEVARSTLEDAFVALVGDRN